MRSEILLIKGRRLFMIAEYLSGVSTLTLIIHLLDILLVWFLVYKLLSLLKGTRGMQLVKGILIVIGLKIFFNFIGFKTMTYIFEQKSTFNYIIKCKRCAIFIEEKRRYFTINICKIPSIYFLYF